MRPECGRFGWICAAAAPARDFAPSLSCRSLRRCGRRAAIHRELCPSASITLVGFSLSGNIVLKLLGEAPDAVPANLVKVAAICPAIDLGRCVRSLAGPVQRMYDRYFVRELCRQIRHNQRLNAALPALSAPRRMRSMFDFDDFYTGPVCGFGSADKYYASSMPCNTSSRFRDRPSFWRRRTIRSSPLPALRACGRRRMSCCTSRRMAAIWVRRQARRRP